MATHPGWFGAFAWMIATLPACAHAPQPGTEATAISSPPAEQAIKFVVLPAESNVFTKAAQATNNSLLHAQVGGLGVAQVSKVSLEVVQLAIECVEPSLTCYEAVGHSLAANDLLFAQISAVTPQQLKVTITLFDVDAKAPRTKAEKVFASEEEATAGIAELVAEVTRP